MSNPSKDKNARQSTQADKFKAAARELETDNDPAKFDRKMKGLKLQTKKSPTTKKPKRGD